MMSAMRSCSRSVAFVLIATVLDLSLRSVHVHAAPPAASPREHATWVREAGERRVTPEQAKQAAQALHPSAHEPAMTKLMGSKSWHDAEFAVLASEASTLGKAQPADSSETAGASEGNSTEPSGTDLPQAQGISPHAIALPSTAGSTLGLGESFAPQLSTGTLTFRVPIELPPSRGRVQPNLDIGYSSAGGFGIAGLGWSGGAPAIVRQTDHGTPSFQDAKDYHVGQDRFLFAGAELVPICTVKNGACVAGETFPTWSEGWQYFRAEREASYTRLFWSPDHRTWRVQGQDGVNLEFGVPLDGSAYDGALERDPDHLAHIARWYVVRQYDNAGDVDRSGLPAPVNVVAYRYFSDLGVAYLSDVYFTPPAGNAETAPLTEWAHHARLEYDDRADWVMSYRSGFEQTYRLRLARLDIASKPFDGPTTAPRVMIRRYHFDYAAGRHASLLESVSLEGRCATPITESAREQLPSSNCPRLPSMRFSYDRHGDAAKELLDQQGLAFEPLGHEIEEIENSPPHSLSESEAALTDMNGDGLVDLLVTSPQKYAGNHAVYFGRGASDNTRITFGGPSLVPVLGSKQINAASLSIAAPRVSALDANGDGLLDLVHTRTTGEHTTFSFTPAGNSFTWTAKAGEGNSGTPEAIRSSRDSGSVRALDANGDGLVDFVVTHTSSVETHFALGRYPGGQGRFGSAEANGDSWTLSDEPVRACAPWSALPVRFSDPDVYTADMNGDGFVDIVRFRPGQMLVWPGRGNGFWGTGDREDCLSEGHAVDRHVEVQNAPHFSLAENGRLFLTDVNGDGFADVTHVRATGGDVYLNDSGIGFTDRYTLEDAPFNGGAVSSVRLADLNGNGTPDLVWGKAKRYEMVDLSGGSHPNLLTRVENGLGRVTQFEYQSSTEHMREAAALKHPWDHYAPTSTPLVVRSTTFDNLDRLGFQAGRYTTEYRYRDPLFIGSERSFRGFREAEVRTLGDASSPTAVTTTSFVYGPCESFACVRSRDKEHLGAADALPATVEQHDGQGLYLSTAHTSYSIVELYMGRDGRRVVAVNPVETDSYHYDTSNFSTNDQKQTLPTVTFALQGISESPVVQDVHVRAVSGTAHTRSTFAYNRTGHATETVHEGCIDGCPLAVDEAITTHSEFALPAGDLSGWQWREVRTYTTGEDHPEPRHEVRRVHDTHGNLVETHAILSGTLPLFRQHAAGGVVAPVPPDASSGVTAPVEIVVGRSSYDRFGNTITTSASHGRCAKNDFDTAYAALVIRAHRFAGATGPDGCGTRDFTNDYTYDRGLDLLTAAVSVDGQPSSFVFDGFGRLLSVTNADPKHPGNLAPLPFQTWSYALTTDPVQVPYSIVATSVLNGADFSEAKYATTSQYVDGLGRTVLAAEEADPGKGDAGTYVISGLIDRNAKGLAIRAYEPQFLPTNGLNAPLAQLRNGIHFSAQVYDAFGRTVETKGLDGQTSSRIVHHPLAADMHDVLDDEVGGPRYGTYATQNFDGHGRSRESISRLLVDGQLELHHVRFDYLPGGEVEKVVQSRAGSPDVVRWFRYDSLGRLVLNAEPNTSLGFSADPNMSITNLKAYRYAYSDAGDLVGVSDARGCGVNYHYDSGGRLIAADRSPCLAEHPPYSPPNLTTGDGTETFYQYDDSAPDAAGAVDAAGQALSVDAVRLKGRLVATSDQASRTLFSYDGLGRLTGTARRLAHPGGPSATLASRYAPRWYVKSYEVDAVGRIVGETSGASTASMLQGGRSRVSYSYSQRGSLVGVQSSYGDLVRNAVFEADGQTTAVTYGDLAQTERAFSYDALRRISTVQTFRGPPPLWSEQSPPAGYHAPEAGTSPTRHLVLEDNELGYDAVGNITSIKDWRDPALWPTSHGPVSRTFEYDDAYRLAKATYSYAGASAPWESPYAAENAGQAAGHPSPHVSFSARPKEQAYRYDYLGNQVRSGDDAGGFFDRSLGASSYGTPARGPHQLTQASNRSTATGTRRGDLDIAYDAAGNMTDLIVRRDGSCLPSATSCWQRFRYEWSETSELVRARRWDLTGAERSANASIASSIPARAPEAELHYAYDASGRRTRKTGVDGDGNERHTLYVFTTLELRSTDWAGTDFLLEAKHEQVLLPMGSYGFARAFATERALPEVEGNDRHVLINLTDHLGSGTVSIDRETSELAERMTYMAYGARESDYRPDRWGSVREPYGFGGKEEDIEVGLSYFGARYYSPYLGVWLSPDPGTIHQLASDLNPYSYAGGTPLMKVDPDGRYIFFACAGVIAVAYAIAIAVVVGAVVGVVLSTAAYGIRVAITGEQFKWGLDGLGGAALTGGVTGGISGGIGAVAGPIAGAAISGVVSGALGDIMTQKFAGRDNIDWGHVGISAGVGLGIGLAGYGLGLGISKAFKGSPKPQGTQASGTPDTAPPPMGGGGASSAAEAGTADLDKIMPNTAVPDSEVLNPTSVTDDMLLKSAGKSGVEKPGGGELVRNADAPLVAPDEYNLPVAKASPPQSVCFPAGTPVATPEGTRAIEELDSGDLVWSFDFETSKVVARPITETFARTAPELIEVSFDSHSVRSTPSHPYWVDGLGWRPAAELSIGMVLHTLDGALVEITDLRALHGDFDVFNLEVAYTHAFYVGAPAVLVHNMSGKGGGPRVGGGGTLAGLSEGEAARIQRFADSQKVEVNVVGSKAAGTAGAESDIDYVIDAASKVRSRARASLPRGGGGGEMGPQGPTGIDVMPGKVNPAKPHVTFTPR